MTIKTAIAIALAIAIGQPASAQMFWQSPDFRGSPILAGEPAIGIALPGANPIEVRANYVWQMRAALNVMALQCQFESTLLAGHSYNAILLNHKDELANAYAVLTKYFARTNKTPKGGRDALDRYGTKTYLGFSTVRAQVGFCQAASGIAKSVMFAPRGTFETVTMERLRELRNSLVPAYEQQFRPLQYSRGIGTPDLSANCWDKKGRYKGCASIN
jgi:hypothetical protein